MQPMINAAKKQLGIQPEVVRNSDKHEVLPTHAIYVAHHVMFPRFHKQALVPSCD